MPTKPNILLITTDQQRFDTIHAAGNPSIFTPHLNWLCDTGIRYTRNYSDCPVSAPSRATIMTGLHGSTHGQTSNNSRQPIAGRPTIPSLLTAAGYQTRGVGKMHFSPLRAHYGFEHMQILPDYYREIARLPHVRPPKDHGIGENEMEPVFSTTDEQHSLTRWTVDRSIDFIETRDDTRPFFLWTSFSKPHPPFDAPRQYWDIYDGIPMPEPHYGDWSQSIEAIPQGFMGPTYHLNNIHRFTPEKLRATMRAYYACISQIDYNLGLLFARLREMKLLESTWIIFTADHGEMLGDHHMGAKSVFFEGSGHIPLIVRPPATGWQADSRAGDADDRLACLADLLPTVLNMAGVAMPPGAPLEGLDLLGTSQRDTLFGECGAFHAVITRDWKYHFTAEGGGELLFRVSDDPYEQRDLARSASDKLNEMRSRLIERLSARNHPAVKDGRLVPTSPAQSEREARRGIWPGFHWRGDQTCDMLH
jgi:arylsulfatase A-like enzyme